MKSRSESEGQDAFQNIHDESHVDEERQPSGNEQFIQQIKETADKLLRDQANRGDVKLLNTAIKELRYAFKVFAPYRNRRKVTIFGSARLPESHPAYQQAVIFGQRISEQGFFVITGAASGIMEAGNRGAGRENSFGVNILLPFEQEANSIIARDAKLVHLKYFFTRKLLFVKESDAIALFPGGFGTLDEGFEVLTLIQTGKSHIFPIVLIDEPGGDYWKRWHSFITDVLVARGLISASDLSLFKLTNSVDEAVEEITSFYRVYHSMRYVKDELVMRLQRPLSEALMERIRQDFSGILGRGTFVQCEALAAEGNEVSLLALPRLRFHFDRFNLGKLRLLIDFINREA